jgi:hypothetical protein
MARRFDPMSTASQRQRAAAARRGWRIQTQPTPDQPTSITIEHADGKGRTTVTGPAIVERDEEGSKA